MYHSDAVQAHTPSSVNTTNFSELVQLKYTLTHLIKPLQKILWEHLSEHPAKAFLWETFLDRSAWNSIYSVSVDFLRIDPFCQNPVCKPHDEDSL